jgi:hypothetical protein
MLDLSSARSISAHPCKKRKDGAPSVRMVHAKIVEGGPRPHINRVIFEVDERPEAGVGTHDSCSANQSPVFNR